MNRIGQLLVTSAMCLIGAAAPQQERPPVRTVPSSPRMYEAPRVVKDDDTPPAPPISLSDTDGQGLILEELSVRTAVEGMLSLTELDLRFRNPKPRRIEGRFSCTLPANATISRFAKEVNGHLMEGEVVERLRANQVYEQFLHQMRDPALLEQDQGNRFSARIFPIEANAATHLVLSYSAVLPMKEGIRRYALPMRGMASIGHFTFRAYVTPLPGEEGPGSSKSDVSGLSGATHSTADVISVDENNYTPARDIELTWHPTASAPRMQLLTAGDFYAAAYRPDVAMLKIRAMKQSWTLYVDTSASSAEGAEHRIHAIETLLASMPPDETIELVAFDQEIVPLGSGSCAELARTAGALLRKRLFLGGTDLGSLLKQVAERASHDPERTFVIASDLVATLGDVDRHALTEEMKAIPARTKLHVLVLGSRQDAAVAKALTAGHGRVVTIPFTESIDAQARLAADALRRPLGTTVDVADGGAEWVYPAHAYDVQGGDEVIVFGRMKPAATPRPHFVGGAVAAESSQSLPAGIFAPLLEREAYRAYLDYLGEREANEPSEAVRNALATEQVKISVERRVVIPRTTMLVLETEFDYQRFGIERRSLASILTIDAGGIGVIDRRDASLAPIVGSSVSKPIARGRNELEKNPVTAAPKQAVAPGDDSSTVNGVVGGLLANAPMGAVSGVASFDHALDQKDAGQAGGVTDALQVTAEAPAIDPNRPVSAGRPAAPIPPPPPSPHPVPAETTARTGGGATVPSAAQAIARPTPRTSEERKKSDIEWVKGQIASEQDIVTLNAFLEAHPQDRETYNRLSDALVARSDWPALRRVALQWQPYDPENPQVYEVLGIADEHLGNASEAARADASLIEIAPAKPELLQRAGLLLLRTHHADLAETPLRRALELRPDRVNSYRHLALMLWREGRLEEAAQVLETATRQQFPGWYGNVQRVIREELGYVYRAWGKRDAARRGEIEERARTYQVDLNRHDALRVTLAWETDANDVDLHVVDPDGEECYYSHKNTASGLELYEDITQGLGPEVVRTETLQKGTYHIGVNYFSAGPMGVSRGIVVIIRGDDVEIVPFRLVEGGRDMRYIAGVTVK